MHPRARHILPFVLLLLLAGCDQPDPVELVDNEIGLAELELLNETPPPAMLGMGDVDSTILFAADPVGAYGQLTIAGSVYDGLYIHTEATLARAILFDRSAPVVNQSGDTIGYHTVDVGTLTLDGVPLRQKSKRIPLFDVPGDTVVGVQYVLKSAVDGITYAGAHAYEWQNPDTMLAAPLAATITSPPAIRVTAPTPADVVSLQRNLRVRWEGGGATVRIVISDPTDMRTIIKMRVRRNRGTAVIPRSVLRLLPAENAGFVFTFSSENVTTVSVDGFADEVRVRASTSHSVFLQVTP